MSGKIKAISVSKQRGLKKNGISTARVKADFGIVGDAHAGINHRQVSLLDEMWISELKKRGVDIKPGAFAENITISGINFNKLKIRDRLLLNDSVVLEITQVGKSCDHRCSIYEELGKCSMSDKGLFAKVVEGGDISVGDKVGLIND